MSMTDGGWPRSKACVGSHKSVTIGDSNFLSDQIFISLQVEPLSAVQIVRVPLIDGQRELYLFISPTAPRFSSDNAVNLTLSADVSIHILHINYLG